VAIIGRQEQKLNIAFEYVLFLVVAISDVAFDDLQTAFHVNSVLLASFCRVLELCQSVLELEGGVEIVEEPRRHMCTTTAKASKA
jgi:hypothetical protein